MNHNSQFQIPYTLQVWEFLKQNVKKNYWNNHHKQIVFKF